MKRDIQSLKEKEFDVIVIGAGVHGACVARDASLRGMRVALIDKGDICGATSHNSLKTIHGGIRYLQHLDIARTWASIREQRYWLKTAPRRVKPLPFLMPTYGHGMRGPLAMLAGIMLYALLGIGRNIGLASKSKIRMGRIISAKQCQTLVNDVPSKNLSGAAVWDDAQVEDADQTVLEITEHASQHGAVIANYVAATDFIIDQQKVSGIRATNQLNGDTFEIKGHCVVNATGPWIAQQLQSSSLSKQIEMDVPLVKSMNIVTKTKTNDHAVSFYSRHDSDSMLGNTKRLYFSVPWKDYSVFGTTHLIHSKDQLDINTEATEIQSFLDEINQAHPSSRLGLDDVLYCYQGLTPADAGEQNEAANRLHDSKVIDHRKHDNVDGMVSIVSIKWTTARRVAEQCTNILASKLNIKKKCLTRDTQIPCFDYDRTLCNLVDKELKQQCLTHIEHSMPLNLCDFLLRRTDDFITNKLSAQQLATIIDTFAKYFEWSRERQREEISTLQNTFMSPAASDMLNKIYESLND